MDSRRRTLRRRQLDAQLLPLARLIPAAAPPGGWIHAIREALGMSLAAFAKRMGLASSSTAHQLEQSEVDGGITLKRLRGAADALGCDVAVILVPRMSLTQLAEQRARDQALKRMRRVGHTMSMEDQSVGTSDMEEIVDQLAREILDRGGAKLWD